jgi:hypothetical protein
VVENKRKAKVDEEVEQFISDLFYEQNLKKEIELLDLDTKKVFTGILPIF